MPRRSTLVDPRVMLITALAIALGVAAAFIAQLLVALIALVTNLAFYGRLSTATVSPAGHHLGPWVIVVPVIGGLIVGVMARYGSKAIRGHGIPEAMEQVLLNESRIPPRMTFLKPLSAAIAIGTGGPFGAEGPIIATGGALGSLRRPAAARHRRRAQDAARGRRRGGHGGDVRRPVSAVLLAIELLLFEFRPRSIIPVALATRRRRRRAHRVRRRRAGRSRCRRSPQPGGAALAVLRRCIGAVIGVARVGVTRAVYAIEDALRAPADPLDVVAGARRPRGRRRRLLRAAHAGRRLRQHRATSSRGTARRSARSRCCAC